ncbi:energy coupling factor transporter S component ThiW [Oribacterium sp. C9]|nr:energy coupling factor transporter S component ThiW [Oribacterium sp. C9]
MKGTTYINTKKLALAAFFAAVAVVGSTFSIPVFGAKCSPVQHLVNVLCAIFLGPGYAVGAAFVASLIRNLMGLGSFLAFPGSMCGAFLSGILFKTFKKMPAAYVGEVFGTGVIGGVLSYPVAAFIMGNSSAGVFTFVIPFLISTIGGTVLAIVITMALRQLGLIERIRDMLV